MEMETPMQSKANIMRGMSLGACTMLILALAVHVGNVRAQESSAHDRIYAVTHVDIVPTSTAAGTKLVQQYVMDSRKEKGCVRIEAYVQVSRPNHLVLDEVWQNQKAYDEHVAAEHTRQFHQQLDPVLGSPYDERLHQILE
jgi:quinol monooxygenase YgiN